MVTPTNHVIAQAGFTLNWTPGTSGFSQCFPAKYRVSVKLLYSLTRYYAVSLYNTAFKLQSRQTISMTNIQIGGLQLQYILDNVIPHSDKLWCTSHDQGWNVWSHLEFREYFT